MAKAVKFIKEKQTAFFSDWNVYLDGKFIGYIYKCKRNGTWNIVIGKFDLSATNPAAEQKSLADAKKIIRQKVEEYFDAYAI